MVPKNTGMGFSIGHLRGPEKEWGSGVGITLVPEAARKESQYCEGCISRRLRLRAYMLAEVLRLHRNDGERLIREPEASQGWTVEKTSQVPARLIICN